MLAGRRRGRACARSRRAFGRHRRGCSRARCHPVAAGIVQHRLDRERGSAVAHTSDHVQPCAHHLVDVGAHHRRQARREGGARQLVVGEQPQRRVHQLDACRRAREPGEAGPEDLGHRPRRFGPPCLPAVGSRKAVGEEAQQPPGGRDDHLGTVVVADGIRGGGDRSDDAVAVQGKGVLGKRRLRSEDLVRARRRRRATWSRRATAPSTAIPPPPRSGGAAQLPRHRRRGRSGVRPRSW